MHPTVATDYITIHTQQRALEIPARVIGQIAVHRALTDLGSHPTLWSITHVRTGFAFVRFPIDDFRAACRLAENLNGIWLGDLYPDYIPAKLHTAIQGVFDRWCAEFRQPPLHLSHPSN